MQYVYYVVPTAGGFRWRMMINLTANSEWRRVPDSPASFYRLLMNLTQSGLMNTSYVADDSLLC